MIRLMVLILMVCCGGVFLYYSNTGILWWDCLASLTSCALIWTANGLLFRRFWRWKTGSLPHDA
jgi:hypothetical protein